MHPLTVPSQHQFLKVESAGWYEDAYALSIHISQAILETFLGRAKNFICWRSSHRGLFACALISLSLAHL